MIVYRLCKAAFAALDGEGARLFGGRWNSPGRPMLYAAASPSLAVLEVLVHLDLTFDLLPDDYDLLTLEIPDGASVQILRPTPSAPEACRRAGDAFLEAGEHLILQVDSVVVPQEQNLLVNVRHPEMVGVRLANRQPFRFDPRLFDSP